MTGASNSNETATSEYFIITVFGSKYIVWSTIYFLEGEWTSLDGT